MKGEEMTGRVGRMDGMGDLAEFLLARIAEDEADAIAAGSGPWHWEQGYGEMCNDPECPFGSLMQVKEDGELYQLMEVHGYDVNQEWEGARHIARHDPARVLAECDAKRRIVEFHKSWPVLVEQQPEFAAPATGLNDMTFRMTQRIAWVTQEEYRKRFGEEPPTTPMLRALALPYADHPDFRSEWRA